MLCPYLGTTYAPRGQRPAIRINTSVSDRLYVASAVSAEGKLLFHERQDPYDSQAITEFLTLLLEQVHSNILLVWDGASIHKSKTTQDFLASHQEAQRLHLVIQPAYSPQLNADEQVWYHIKNKALKNTCIQNFKELKVRVNHELQQLAENSALVKKFFYHPELAFY